MIAALIVGQGRVEMREFPEPVPADEGVVVDIALCGICGTDVHAYQSGKPYNPAICGHEWAGMVSAVGRGRLGELAHLHLLLADDQRRNHHSLPCRSPCDLINRVVSFAHSNDRHTTSGG